MNNTRCEERGSFKWRGGSVYLGDKSYYIYIVQVGGIIVSDGGGVR